jgi:hypothetical protein
VTTSRRQIDVSRRRFLQAAVLGSAGIAGLAVLEGMVADSAFADTSDSADTAIPSGQVTEGTILAVGDSSIDLMIDGSESRFSVSGSTEFWRGSSGMTPSDLALGDSLLIRTSTEGMVQMAWANLTRVTGDVLDMSGSALTIANDHGGISVVSTVEFPSGPDGVSSLSTTRPGDSIDVIGLWVSAAGIVLPTLTQAMMVSESDATPSSADASQAAEEEGVPDGTGSCHYTYYGDFTWFTCPTGKGACGTCSTSRSDQIAWPSIGTSCQFSTACVPQIVLSCGSLVNIQDVCTGLAANLAIADCGPDKNKYCSNTCSTCSLSYAHPTVDLTKPSFARFANPAVTGCFPGRAIATVAC